jgi:anti-sigma regulatory factor (Ser/Thr protein kinase)
MTHSSGNGGVSFELKNDLAEMSVLVDQLEGFCEQHDIGPEVAAVVNLALEEIITNIIEYGYADGGDHRIRIDLAHDGANLTARVIDNAAAFGPLRLEDPDIDAPPEARDLGSLGIHLVRSLMDEVTYSRDEDRNILFIRKATAASA